MLADEFLRFFTSSSMPATVTCFAYAAVVSLRPPQAQPGDHPFATACEVLTAPFKS